MSFIKQTGESIMKYGEIIVNKTEGYTRIAKLKLDIKRLEGNIEKCHIKAGVLTTEEYKNGTTSLDLTKSEMKEIVEEIERHTNEINAKKQEIEEIKSKMDSSPNAGKENTGDKQE